jgi:hypothetical protein
MKIAFATLFNALAILASTGWAESAAPSTEPSTLQFRRVYVPEGVKDWPKGDVKYLPMDANEFERKIGQIQRKSTGRPAQSAAGFVESQFDCRLSGQFLLQGSGTLEVSPAIASGMPLTLEPCNLAIDRAQWITSDGAPAVVGTSSDGHLQVLAERAGQMRFDWSLAAPHDSAEATVFAIRLPPCPVNRMRIDLPAELLPAVDHGIIAADGPIESGIRRWTIELGGWSECRLRLAKKRGDDRQQPPFLADQSTAYDVSLRGLDVTVDLSVGAHLGSLRKLDLNVDRSLELLEIVAGGQSLSWNSLPAPGGKWRHVTVELPASLQEGPAKLKFLALAPLTEGEAWKLPRIQVQTAIFRTNTMRLAVSSPLCVTNLTPHGCRQTAASALKSTTGELFAFEIDDPDADVEIALARRSVDVRATCATATVLGQGKMSSRVAADFHVAGGPVFALDAAILPNWTIDSVAAQPADALDEWTVESRASSRRLVVRLAHPLTPARPLRLIVSARRLYAGAGRNVNVRLNMEDVVPLRFDAPIESRRLIDLRTSGAYELRIAAGQSGRADVKELTPVELSLFADTPGDMLLHDNGGASNLRLVLTTRKPSLSTEIRLEAVVSRGILEEKYTFACAPAKTAPIDRLLVRFTEHRDNPLSWSIDGLDESRLSARRWSPGRAAAAGLGADEEVWEVVLGNRRSMPFELRATRKSTISGPLPLCLASLPDAATQRASVLVRSLGPQDVQINTHRVDRLPVPAAAAGQIQTARAAYSYDPREEAVPHHEPAIVLACTDSEIPSAWAWDCDIRSRYAADGAGDHVFTYKIENAGCRHVNLRLPAPLGRSNLREIQINNKPGTAYAADAASDIQTIDLPGDVKEFDLSLHISTSGAPLGSFQRVRPPQLDIALPVLSRHWSIELPPGYATLGADEPAPFTLRRLLGFIGRGEEQKVFDPLRGSDWVELFRSPRGRNNDNTASPSLRSTNLSDNSAYVTVIKRSATELAGCLLFLAVIALGTWPLTGRPIVLTLVTVFCGIASLMAPAAIAGVFSAGLLGVASCLLLALLRKPTEAESSEPTRTAGELPSTLTNVIPYVAPILAAFMLCGGSARAEPPRDASAANSIFIPVNNNGDPTGGKYLVPESFFSELFRRTALRVEKPQGWMIAAAAYRAALTEDVATHDYAVDRLTAEYEVHVFSAPARVRIPLHRDEVSLVPGQAQLDDRPIQPDWEADSSALLVDIAEPGEFRLELALRPNASPDNRGGFEFAVPRVPTAKLEITVPPGGPPVSVPTARGSVRWEAIPSRWIAELGPAERLAVRWQDASATGNSVDVQQLQWLRIEQGCVLLNVRLKASTASPLPRRLQLKTDASLQLLPDPTAAAQPTVTRGSDAMQTIDCQLPRAASGDPAAGALDLHFLCTGASSVGVFRAPQIEVVGTQPAEHWLAVSLNRSLAYQSHGSRVTDAVATLEFMRNWGTGETAPDAAFRLNGNAADWSMTTHVRKAETSSDQRVIWSFDSEEAQVRFDALMVTASGSLFQYHLDIPPALSVDSVAVRGENKEIPSRWFENKDGRLTVFLGGAATGRCQLQLRGRLPIPQNRNFDLPNFRLEDVRVQDSVVRLYRRPAVDVEVSAAAGLAEVKTPEEIAPPAELGEALRSFYLDPAKGGTVTVAIRPLRLPPSPGVAAEVLPSAHAQQSSPNKAPVAAAEVRYVVQQDGRRIGATVLDIESPAATGYALVIPAGFQLLHLTVDGVPVDDTPRQDRKESVPILLQAPRSRVEMLFAENMRTPNENPASISRITFPAPRLDGLPVERTTWAISAPRGIEAMPAAAEGGSQKSDVAAIGDAGDLAAQWRQFAASSGKAVVFTLDGSPDSITVDFRRTDTNNWVWRAAAALVVASALVVVFLRRGLLVDWIQRWPNAAGSAFGICWWLWASPSALGLMIVAAILARQAVIRLRRSRGAWSGSRAPSLTATGLE